MISTLMSSWARFRVFPGRFTCKKGASGRIWSALHCLYPASAKLSVGTGAPQCSQCQPSAGTGVPGAGQCQPGGWHSGAQCPASGAALQCLSPVPVALCASWKRTETDRDRRMKGKTTRRTLHAYVSGTCRRVEARLESARSKSYCALRLVGLWQHAT